MRLKLHSLSAALTLAFPLVRYVLHKTVFQVRPRFEISPVAPQLAPQHLLHCDIVGFQALAVCAHIRDVFYVRRSLRAGT